MKKLLYTLLLLPLFFILFCEDEDCSNPELGYDCDGNFIEYKLDNPFFLYNFGIMFGLQFGQF